MRTADKFVVSASQSKAGTSAPVKMYSPVVYLASAVTESGSRGTKARECKSSDEQN
jgi:hypothetical protein